MKRVPEIWWDFVWVKDRLIGVAVESDHPKYPVVKTFSFDSESELSRQHALDKADSLVADLKSGRLSFKNVVR